MNEKEEREVLDYIRREKAFWNDIADVIKWGIPFALIVSLSL